jgi:hypothetical protein
MATETTEARLVRMEFPFRGVENDTSAYLPLDPAFKENRCIALLNGSFDDTITCELVYTSLHEHVRVVSAVSYTALSYCWGDIDDTIEIQLRCPLSKTVTESTESTGPIQYNITKLASEYTTTDFKITRNLHAALQKIRQDFDRYDTSIRYFWIDALCIDQSNPREKSHQAGLMGEVFSSASSVLVWLGPEDEYSQFLCRAIISCLRPLLAQFVSVRKYTTQLGWNQVASHIGEDMLQDVLLSELLQEVLGQSESSSIPLQDPRDRQFWQTLLRSFDGVLSRSWWSRIWVLQEVLLAPKTHRGALRVHIRIGSDTLHWQDVIDAMRTIDELGELTSVSVGSSRVQRMVQICPKRLQKLRLVPRVLVDTDAHPDLEETKDAGFARTYETLPRYGSARQAFRLTLTGFRYREHLCA